MEVTIDDRSWVMTINGDALCRMFNRDGFETFDVSCAVEVDVGGELRGIREGDELTFAYLGES